LYTTGDESKQESGEIEHACEYAARSRRFSGNEGEKEKKTQIDDFGKNPEGRRGRKRAEITNLDSRRTGESCLSCGSTEAKKKKTDIAYSLLRWE